MEFATQNNELTAQIARFDPFLLSCFRRMASAMSQACPQSELLAEQLQVSIQSHLFLTYDKQPQLTPHHISNDVKFLKSERDKLLDYINANIAERVCIRELADMTGRTTHQLLDACYDAFGKSPYRVVIEQRLRRAREMLGNAHTTITEIAVATGFSSHSHFIRTFQQHYGITPSQFRAEQISLPTNKIL